MQKVIRLGIVSLLGTFGSVGICAAQDMSAAPVPPAAKPATIMNRPLKPAEYKRADESFYPRAEFLKADPGAVVIAKDKYTQTGDSYFFTPRIRAPKVIYGEMSSDWIEPITPPDMKPLGVPPDEMQIREAQGDVQVALPNAPANFAPVTEGMSLPNGAVVKTGAISSAAVIFGGVDSARLMPNSAAAVQQTVTAASRSAEVDLTAGGVFSKVGTQVGVKGIYDVHTPAGNASAQGGDFVTITTSGRTDIWVAQGTVSLDDGQTKTGQNVTADGAGPLKVIRFPASTNPTQSLTSDVETFTAIVNFIPLANQKIKALRDKASAGTVLTTQEQAYLDRIKQVPGLIKLALVEPPAPPPPAPLPPPAPHLALNHASPVASPPLPVDLRADGQVDMNGETVTLDDLKTRLASAAQLDPNQLVLLNGREKVTHDQLLKVIAVCHDAKLKVKVAKAAPLPKAPAAPAVVANPPPAPAPPPPPPSAPVAPKVEAPVIAPPPPVAGPPAPVTDVATLGLPAGTVPVLIELGPDGQVTLSGATTSLTELKARLKATAKAKPAQPIVISRDAKVTSDQLKKVTSLCRQAKLKTKVLKPGQSLNLGTPLPELSVAAPPPPVPAPAPIAPKMEAPKISPPPTETTSAPAPTPVSPPIFDQAFPSTNSVAKTPPPPPAPPAPEAAAIPPSPSVPPPSAPLKPMRAVVRIDGKINFQGATYELPGFKAKLEELMKANPEQPIVLKAGKTVPYDNIKAAKEICDQANVKNVTMPPPPPPGTETASAPTPATNAPSAVAAATNAPAAVAAMTNAPAAVTNAPAAPAAIPPAPAGPSPMKITVRVDGKINFQGATYELPEFKSKLQTIIAAAPDQEFVLHAGSSVPYDKVKAVIDTCTEEQVKHLDVAASALPPSTGNLPGPSLRMPSSMVPASDAPTSTPASPTVTSPPQSGP
jgi:biopolymer transport protein ExbD